MIATPYFWKKPGSVVHRRKPRGGGFHRGHGFAHPQTRMRLAAVRLRRGVLHLLRDRVDVVRVCHEVREALPQPLPGGATERGRLQVGQVEAEHFRFGQPGRRGTGDLVQVGGFVDVLVRRREAAAGDPDLRRFRGREVLEECRRRLARLEVDAQVAAADDGRFRALDRTGTRTRCSPSPARAGCSSRRPGRSRRGCPSRPPGLR